MVFGEFVRFIHGFVDSGVTWVAVAILLDAIDTLLLGSSILDGEGSGNSLWLVSSGRAAEALSAWTASRALSAGEADRMWTRESWERLSTVMTEEVARALMGGNSRDLCEDAISMGITA